MKNKFSSNRGTVRILSAFSLLGIVFGAQASAPSADFLNANYSGGVDFFDNTDLAMGGVGNLRSSGAGTITVNSLSGGVVSKAYLYWAGPNETSTPGSSASILFNGSSVSGSEITGGAVQPDNNWGYPNSQAYRADVTSLVGSIGPVNNYTVAGFPSSPTYGDYFVNGASLVILYQDGNHANDRDVAIFGGNDSNQNDSAWGAVLQNIPYSGTGAAYLHLGVSDGQASLADDPFVSVNGSTLLAADWNGLYPGSGNPEDDANNGLWDLASWDITSALSPGLNDLTLQTGVNFGAFNPQDPNSPLWDYTSLIHGVLDLPQDSFNAVPEPSTIVSGIAFASLAAVRLLRRRK